MRGAWLRSMMGLKRGAGNSPAAEAFLHLALACAVLLRSAVSHLRPLGAVGAHQQVVLRLLVLL